MDAQAFEDAKDALKTKDYKAAERAFRVTLDSIDETAGLAYNGRYNLVESYYGLAQVLNSNEDGLLLCRDAASKELYEGDVFLHLACAELECGNRKRAIDAVQHGMKLDENNERLKHACVTLDCRKRCCIGFLPRDHFINRFLGRLRRRKYPDVNAAHDLLCS
jgi:hypothetical protein